MLCDPKDKNVLLKTCFLRPGPQNCINYSFINDRCNNLIEEKPNSPDFIEDDTFDNYLNSLTMKEILVYSNDYRRLDYIYKYTNYHSNSCFLNSNIVTN